MKKIICLLLILLIPSVLGAVIETTPYISTSLFSQTPDPVQPGNYVEVRVKIENLGAESIDDLQVELVEEFPFTLDEPALKEYGRVQGGIRGDDAIIAKWRVRVDDNAVEGDNDLQIRYKFGTSDNWIYPNEFTVSVRTLDAILNVVDISTTPENVMPGETFTLDITVENQADSFLKNVKFDLDIADPFVTIGSINDKYIKQLPAGATQTVSFNLLSKGDADQTVYTLPLDITYYDNEETVYNKEASFGLIITEEPNLVVNLETSEVISKGDRGRIVFSISNVGVDEVKFVTATLRNSDNYDVISTSAIYLGNVDSDDFETADYEIVAQSKESSVPLELHLEYRDSLNKPYVEDVTVQLPLYSSSEAKRLGLKPAGNFASAYIGFTIFIFGLVFWLIMAFDLLQRKTVRYQKLLWGLLLVLTTIFGAVLYYFMVYRKSR